MALKGSSPFKEGDVVWARWGKYFLPARIAKETEASPVVLNTKKSGTVLVFWFETHDYSYVTKNYISPWTEDAERRRQGKSSKIFMESLAAADAWKKKPGEFPVYDSDNDAGDGESSKEDSEESSDSSSGSNRKSKSQGSPKKEKSKKDKESQGSPKKRKREDDAGDDVPPEKHQRVYGKEEEPKGVRKLRVMRELGLIAPEGSPWAKLAQEDKIDD